jgi:FAD/FMN-containing dehydrogenase
MAGPDGSIFVPMLRRGFVQTFILAITYVLFGRRLGFAAEKQKVFLDRVRPTDAAWPGAASWQKLKDAVSGNLISVRSLFKECESNAASAACLDVVAHFHNPYYIGDQPGGTQISGWLDAWTPAPSIYAIVARNAADVAAGVNFARENNLRLVVKGGAHSYQGTSNAPDSLLIWTRSMNKIELHDSFRPRGSAGPPQRAVSIGAGAMWMDVYDTVTTKGGRYVQGGGCATVGVAGLIQSGGFGSFSKQFGLACSDLLEAEIVTADGRKRTANESNDPELFWALKGGGGGTFGIVTKVTLRTHELPETFGDVSVSIKAKSDEAFRKLITSFVNLYSESLFGPHWGESVNFRPSNTLSVNMVFSGLKREAAEGVWRKFLDQVQSNEDLEVSSPFTFEIMPARDWWDIEYLQKYSVGSVTQDKRPGASSSHAWWSGDGEQVGIFMHSYQSVWLPATLLKGNARKRLADALFASSRNWNVGLHFNKGLAGAPPAVVSKSRKTAVNPAVTDAFALAIVASDGPPAYPGLPGASSDIARGRKAVAKIDEAMANLFMIAPDRSSYVAESNFFERAWQASFWGSNYAQLRAIKDRYDPGGLFFVHHGIGSEDWSADGFTRIRSSKDKPGNA